MPSRWRRAAAGTSELRRQYSRAVVTVLVIAALVLLVACANIANLLIARGAERRRELSLRLALGAPRRRLIQQLLVESLILASTGAVLGLLVASWASDALVTQMSTWFDRVTLDVSLDWRVVTFTVLTTLATALLFGLMPAFRASQVTPVSALKDLMSTGQRAARASGRGGLVARAGCALADARHRRRTVHQDLRPPARRATGLRQRSRARRRDQRQPHRVRDRCAIGALPAADRGRRRSARRHASGSVPQHSGQSWRHAGRRLRRARDAAAASSRSGGRSSTT